MEASIRGPARIPISTLDPDTEKIKRKLLRVGVFPTPKIVHTLRKKEIQKSVRHSKRIADKNKALGVENPLSESQKQAFAEEALFQDISREYKTITRSLKANPRPGDKTAVPLVGLPWESSSRAALRELESSSKEYNGEKVKEEHLEEFRQILSHRNRSSLRWLLDDDIEERCCPEYMRSPAKRRVGEADAIHLLVDRFLVLGSLLA